MSIEDEVFGALSGPKSLDDLSAVEIFERGAPAGIDDLRTQLDKILVEGDQGEVYRFVAMASSLDIFPPAKLIQLLLLSEEYSLGEGRIEEVVREFIVTLQEREEEIRQETFVGSWRRAILFLSEVWGDDLASVLADLTAVSPATARRWVDSRSLPRQIHIQAIWRVARLFYLLSFELEMTPDDLRRWFERPLENGKTPREEYLRSPPYHNYPGQVRHFLLERGISVEPTLF